MSINAGTQRWPSSHEGGIILTMAKRSPMKRSPALDETRLRQQAIGAQLRRMFEDVVNEPVPAEFMDLLKQADGQATDHD